MTAMRWRPALTLAAALTLLLNGCHTEQSKAPAGEQVAIVAGGGAETTATKALDLSLSGVPNDFEVGRDGVARLMVTQSGRVLIWTFKPDGSATRIDVDPKITDVSQLAVADDGNLYISHLAGRVWCISKVDRNGRATPVIVNGQPAPTAGAQNGRGDVRIDGIAIDRQGRLVFVEDAYNVALQQAINLVRRVEANGHITTIAGRAGVLSPKEYAEAIVGSVAPPPGTRATDWPLPGLGELDSLAVGEDDTIFVQAHRGVLAVAPDGTIRAIARRRDNTAALVADRPFTREGEALDADPRFIDHASITADRGFLTMPVTHTQSEESRSIPAAFRWVGEYSDGQRAIIEAAGRRAGKDRLQQILRIVRPDGSVTTGAWAVDGGAVRGGNLYLLIRGDNNQLMIGKIELPN